MHAATEQESIMRACQIIALAAVLSCCGIAAAQDSNITRPTAELEQMLDRDALRIVSAEISRPKARGDITLKAEASFNGGEPMRIKLRKSVPGAEEFNNVPRYDLAAYELQKLLLDGPEYLVPPTALRFVPLEEFRRYTDQVRPTFKGSSEVLAVLQYWLQNVTVVADVLDPARFEADAVYARHIGQLNVFTYLIEHRDANLGNFLLSKAEQGPRVFSIDHGVAFNSEDSDRGEIWSTLRVRRFPADTIGRLRALTREELDARLGVLAEWRLEDGHWQTQAPGPNLSPQRGVRLKDGVLQMGLTRHELGRIWTQRGELLDGVDDGKLTTY
jgi:hypothetical protein